MADVDIAELAFRADELPSHASLRFTLPHITLTILTECQYCIYIHGLPICFSRRIYAL
jgi:hypothetical protein